MFIYIYVCVCVLLRQEFDAWSRREPLSAISQKKYARVINCTVRAHQGDVATGALWGKPIDDLSLLINRHLNLVRHSVIWSWKELGRLSVQHFSGSFDHSLSSRSHVRSRRGAMVKALQRSWNCLQYGTSLQNTIKIPSKYTSVCPCQKIDKVEIDGLSQSKPV